MNHSLDQEDSRNRSVSKWYEYNQWTTGAQRYNLIYLSISSSPVGLTDTTLWHMLDFKSTPFCESHLTHRSVQKPVIKSKLSGVLSNPYLSDVNKLIIYSLSFYLYDNDLNFKKLCCWPDALEASHKKEVQARCNPKRSWTATYVCDPEVCFSRHLIFHKGSCLNLEVWAFFVPFTCPPLRFKVCSPTNGLCERAGRAGL